ncbi:hypothetical protein ACFOGJ_19980 [Marinibaculum pumilum]|uniref:Uncharacterized protein n=1 Tax=Marinibaculum pumilum TaxID=1766165 RepID=A0ABV7L4I0_9PROT
MDMQLHGRGGEVQTGGDLLVGATLRQAEKHLALSDRQVGQAGGIRAGTVTESERLSDRAGAMRFADPVILCGNADATQPAGAEQRVTIQVTQDRPRWSRQSPEAQKNRLRWRSGFRGGQVRFQHLPLIGDDEIAQRKVRLHAHAIQHDQCGLLVGIDHPAIEDEEDRCRQAVDEFDQALLAVEQADLGRVPRLAQDIRIDIPVARHHELQGVGETVRVEPRGQDPGESLPQPLSGLRLGDDTDSGDRRTGETGPQRTHAHRCQTSQKVVGHQHKPQCRALIRDRRSLVHVAGGSYPQPAQPLAQRGLYRQQVHGPFADDQHLGAAIDR